ncbi:hypothetical protein [Thalassobacillus sp. CUG 92003]|uniref:hypothetical protein n=1 Tax=Thalassobacillus sp. CUG 92003 TaxID=2736641 RepID=UPI0015E6A60F|nr:hypothetical protein [Thalassobacillus sp. CUG 92003]
MNKPQKPNNQHEMEIYEMRMEQWRKEVDSYGVSNGTYEDIVGEVMDEYPQSQWTEKTRESLHEYGIEESNVYVKKDGELVVLQKPYTNKEIDSVKRILDRFSY